MLLSAMSVLEIIQLLFGFFRFAFCLFNGSVEFCHELEKGHAVEVGEIAVGYDVFPLLVFVDSFSEEAIRRHSECILLSSSHIAE